MRILAFLLNTHRFYSFFTYTPFTTSPLESIMTSIPPAFIVTESLSVVITDSPTL
ncbi:hypothetical protein [Helicobacter bilis]|uniref:hypothetical protein n=1 Tax=Helicobacter bilis TaxID=37372 RepID=UPI002557C884|nr:hypothetical protein [Helicobacter bilis]